MVGSLASRVEAHPEFNPTHTNRYLKITVLGDELRLVYSVLYGQGPAAAALRAADLDANGRVDGDEAGKLGAALRNRVLAGLSLSVDGQPAKLELETPTIGFLGGTAETEVAPNPFTVDLVARVRLPKQPQHALVVDDRTELADLGENEVHIEDGPNAELIGTARGVLPAQPTRETRFVFVGARQSVIEDRSISARWRHKAATSAQTPSSLLQWWWVGLVLAALAAIGWLARRRKTS